MRESRFTGGQIHPWPNSNGRHARLATDLLLRAWGRPEFTWGGPELAGLGNARDNHLAALRAADGGAYSRLSAFVRPGRRDG